jgi:hypothetical protein
MRTTLGQSCVLGNMPNALYAHFAKIVDNPQTFLPKSHVGPVLQKQNLENLRRNYYAPIRRGSPGIT